MDEWWVDGDVGLDWESWFVNGEYIYGLRYSSGVPVLSWGQVTRVEFQDAKLGLFDFFLLLKWCVWDCTLPYWKEGG